MKLIIQEIDGLVRSGKPHIARRRLTALWHKKIPRECVVEVASLARRCALPSFSIRLLNPLVRPSVRSQARASIQEKAEYAGALIKIGAPKEALEILKDFPANDVPEALLYESFAHISHWNYAEALPILHRYLRLRSLTSYQQIIGKLNLAAALVHEQEHSRAEPILHELRDRTREENLILLHGNALELSAQLAIQQEDFDSALKFLKDAESLVGKTGGLENLFVKKWRAVLSLLRTKGGKESQKEIARVREEAKKLQHWETIRDCDRYLAITTQSSDLFLHLYFGTPHSNFQDRLLSEFTPPPQLPLHYEWKIKRGAQPVCVDLTNNEVFKAGQLLHRLTQVLASDFYRPFRLASLHAAIYPESKFNPVSSPLKVHQALKRLREEFRRKKLPLFVSESQESYRLHSELPLSLRVTRSGKLLDRTESQLTRLSQCFGKKPFSMEEAASALGIAPRSAVRLLLEGQRRSQVLRTGKARFTRYHF